MGDVEPESVVGADGVANSQADDDDEIIFDKIVVHSSIRIPSSTYKTIHFQPRIGGPTFERPDQLYKRIRRRRERTKKPLELPSLGGSSFAAPRNDEDDEVTFLPPTSTNYTQTLFDFPKYQEQPPAVLDEQNDNHSFNSQPTSSPDYSSLSTNSNQSDVTTEELTKSMEDQSFCDLDTTPQQQNQIESDEPAIKMGEELNTITTTTTSTDTLLEDEQGHDFAGSKGPENYSCPVTDTQSSTDGLLNSREHLVTQNNCPEPMSTSFEEDYGTSSFNFIGLNTKPVDKSLDSESNDFLSSMGSLSDLLSGLPSGDSNDLCSVTDLLHMAESNWGFPPGGLEDIVTMCSNEEDLNLSFQQSHETLSDDPTVPVPQTNKSPPETPPQPSKIKEAMDYTDDAEIIVTPIRIRVYRCCICLECDFSSQEQLMHHIIYDHKISTKLTCEVVSCSEDEIDVEQKDVDRYEREIGRMPGRIHLNKSNNAESEWQDLSDSDSSSDESISNSSSSSTSSNDDDPDYVEQERRRRRCTRKKASNRPKSQNKTKSVPAPEKASAKREPLGRRLRQRPSKVTK